MIMLRQDKGLRFHRVLNIILAVLYIPYAFLCSLAGLVQDGLVNETNLFPLVSGQIVCWCGILTALTTHLCLYLSDRLYKSGKIVTSYIVRFLPLINMTAAFLIFALAEALA